MHRRRFIQSLTTVAVSGSLNMKNAVAGNRPLLLGVFPRRNVKQTYMAFTPMARYLQHALGRPVQLVATRKFSDFWADVQYRRFDIVHFNQYHYLVARKYFGYEVILKNQEFGNDSFSSALFVRKDSGLSSIADLKDRTILFGGGKRAMLSYIAPTWMLRNAGLNAGDYVEKIALNPPNALISTYHGQADAAGAGDTITRLGMVRKNIDVSQLKYLARTEKLAHLPWAVRDDLSVSMRSRIKNALTGLIEQPAGQAILQGAQLTALTVATDDDYASSEKIIKELYGDNYGESDW